MGTTLTRWETVGAALADYTRLIQSPPCERVVAALVRDRTDLARLRDALRPTTVSPQAGVLRVFDRIDALYDALRAEHVDVLVIEPVDADGRSTTEVIRYCHAQYPRLCILGHLVMRPGMSAHFLTFARAGVHELVVAGIDDSAAIVRHALQRASRQSMADEVFGEISASLPKDAARLVRYCLEHATESPSVDDIASALGVHRRTLVNRMQQAMLPPPSELWAWSRVLLSARYLEVAGRSVEWVAHAVGYPSANALRNALKRYTGLVPSELREGHGFARASVAFRSALLATSRSDDRVQNRRRPPLSPLRARRRTRVAAHTHHGGLVAAL